MQLQLLGPSGKFPPAHLVEPPPYGYLQLAAVVTPPAGPAPFPRNSPAKNQLLNRLKELARALSAEPDVVRATVYQPVLLPPAAGYARRSDVHHARYDVVVLVETTTPEVLGPVQDTEAYRQLHDALAHASTDLHVMAARCVKSIGDVDKSRTGLYLFYFFVADDVDVALRLWDHLASWYRTQTGLTNSTVLQPVDGKSDYAFVNHGRWDYGLPRLFASQFTKPSFRSFVLANLLVNRVGAMPLLYHLA